jgi:hypothetical protein
MEDDVQEALPDSMQEDEVEEDEHMHLANVLAEVMHQQLVPDLDYHGCLTRCLEAPGWQGRHFVMREVWSAC